MLLQCVGEAQVDAPEECRPPEENTLPAVNKRLRAHGIWVNSYVVVGAHYGGGQDGGKLQEDIVLDLIEEGCMEYIEEDLIE